MLTFLIGFVLGYLITSYQLRKKIVKKFGTRL